MAAPLPPFTVTKAKARGRLRDTAATQNFPMTDCYPGDGSNLRVVGSSGLWFMQIARLLALDVLP